MKQKYLFNVVFIILTMVFATSVFSKEYEIDQNSKSFKMDGKKVEAVTIKVGDTIRFKNEDPFFHNIFSLSDLKTFDLGSFPKGQSKTVTFDKAGLAEVECAIHPEMYMEVSVQ
ncbi:MAG: plastocyanin/azurin family copper-binding protein [Gammaproteobacteria bacterium]|nr:plastocyanin/azurin family copper-binding protein [Gammaproteobacteria bacterium]